MTLFLFNATGLSGNGLFPSEGLDVTVTNKAAGTMSVGDLVMFDGRATGSGVTSVDPGGSGTSIYNCVIAPNAGSGQFLHAYFGVVLGPVAVVGVETKVRCFGLVESAFILYSAGSAAIGDPLIAAATKDLDGATATAGAKVLARARAVVTTPTTRTLSKVDFNGITGFGVRAG